MARRSDQVRAEPDMNEPAQPAGDTKREQGRRPLLQRRSESRSSNNTVERRRIGSAAQIDLSGSPFVGATALEERTRRENVTFAEPFFVDGTEAEHPAGTYAVETVEERIEGLSFLAYRQASTSIVLPVPGSGSGSYQLARIDPALVRAARFLERPQE